jgi:hypothetical protein
VLCACWPILLSRPREAQSTAPRAQFKRPRVRGQMDRGIPEVQARNTTRNTHPALGPTTVLAVQSASSTPQTMFLPGRAPSRCRGIPVVQAGNPTRNTPARGLFQHVHSHANHHEWPHGPVQCQCNSDDSNQPAVIHARYTSPATETNKISAGPDRSSQLVFPSARDTGEGFLRGKVRANQVLGW